MRLFTLLLLLLHPLFANSAIDKLDNTFENMVDEMRPPSLSYAVLKEGKLVYMSSFGFNDYKKRQLSDNESVYHIYSLSKMFAVTIAMQLRQEGLLDFNSDIKRYFPHACFTYEGKIQHIKVINLLNHSSGIGDRSSEVRPFFDGLEHEEYECYELPHSVGSEAKYSSAEYMVLQKILEMVSNQPFAQLVRERIFVPLGMEKSDFYYNEKNQNNQVAGTLQRFSLMGTIMRAMSSEHSKDHYEGNTFYMHPFEVQWHAAGGIISNIHEMSLFLDAFEHNRLFSKESAEFMHNYPLVQVHQLFKNYDDVKFSIGWYYITNHGHTFYQHQGMGPGFRTIMRIYPKEELSLILLTNQTETDVDALADTIFDTFKDYKTK